MGHLIVGMLRVPERASYEYCTSIVRVLYVVDEDSFSDETLRFRPREGSAVPSRTSNSPQEPLGVKLGPEGANTVSWKFYQWKRVNVKLLDFLAMLVGTMQYSSGFYLNKTLSNHFSYWLLRSHTRTTFFQGLGSIGSVGRYNS